MKLAFVAVVVMAVHAPPAHANSACAGEVGWSPQRGDELPPRAHLVYWANRRGDDDPKSLVATIDGKAVAVKQKTIDATPYRLTLIEIESDRTGKLSIGWKNATDGYVRDVSLATYTVKAKVAYAKEATATTRRYHRKIPHSTVREVFDGLAIAVDTPAILAHVKLRRDAQAAWNEIDSPLTEADGRTIRIGELGCTRNYSPPLLENGVDLEVDLTLPDGSRVHVKDLAHVVLPKLAKPTGDNPWDSE
jgi:hypothetical protein